MSNIFLTLEQTLKRLRPNLILESSEFEKEERHMVSIWLDILPRNYLTKNSSVKSNIYNEGKLEIDTTPQDPVGRGFYAILYEPHVNESRRKRKVKGK